MTNFCFEYKSLNKEVGSYRGDLLRNMEAERVIRALLCLTGDQKEIKFQNVLDALNTSEPKFHPWDLLKLYKGFYPSDGQEGFSGYTSAPTVAETVISLQNQTDKYQSVLYGLTQAIEANRKITIDVPQVYANSSIEERLRHKLFYARMLEQTNELNKAFKAVLTDMEKIDSQSEQLPITAVCGLPKEIWVHILNQFDNESLQLCEPVIRATSYSLYVLMNEYKTTRAKYSSAPVRSILVKAAANGYLNYVKFLHQVGRKLDSAVAFAAIQSGDIDLVKFVHGSGAQILWTSVLLAAKSGNFPVFLYALQHNGSTPQGPDRDLATASLEGGNIDIITSAMTHVKQHVGLVDEYDTICKHKSAKDIIELLANNGVPVNNWKKNKGWTMSSAKYGNIECLKYLIEQGFEVHEDCAGIAQLFGCITSDTPIDQKQIWMTAALHCTEETVKLLFDKAPFDSVYFQEARNEKVALWLARQDVPLPDNICDLAAQRGHYDLLVFAHSKGKPFSKDIVTRAARSRSLACLKYVLENGGTIGESDVNDAAVNDNVEVFALFMEHGGTISEELSWKLVYMENRVCRWYSDWASRKNKK